MPVKKKEMSFDLRYMYIYNLVHRSHNFIIFYVQLFFIFQNYFVPVLDNPMHFQQRSSLIGEDFNNELRIHCI